MDETQILNTFKSLAQSTGFYGRLVRDLEECKETNPAAYKAYMDDLVSHHFEDDVDLIMYIES